MKEPAYAIVVLGAAVRRGRPTATLRARLDAAHAAFEAGRAPRIIVTGYCEADAMAHYLVERGISPSVIERELYATSTHENAKNTAALVPKDARLLLCTQPSHQVRAQTIAADGTPAGSPLLLSAAGINAGQPQIAVGSDGRGVVAFLAAKGKSYEVHATPVACVAK